MDKDSLKQPYVVGRTDSICRFYLSWGVILRARQLTVADAESEAETPLNCSKSLSP